MIRLDVWSKAMFSQLSTGILRLLSVVVFTGKSLLYSLVKCYFDNERKSSATCVYSTRWLHCCDPLLVTIK